MPHSFRIPQSAFPHSAIRIPHSAIDAAPLLPFTFHVSRFTLPVSRFAPRPIRLHRPPDGRQQVGVHGRVGDDFIRACREDHLPVAAVGECGQRDDPCLG